MTTNGYKVKIAYAEDERWFRDRTVDMLTDNGFEVICSAKDGHELIDYLEKINFQPDIFLTDLRMPGMNGIQLTTKIISKWPDAKVVILSSEVETVYISASKKAGAISFLHKLLDYDEIVPALIEIFKTGKTYLGN